MLRIKRKTGKLFVGRSGKPGPSIKVGPLTIKTMEIVNEKGKLIETVRPDQIKKALSKCGRVSSIAVNTENSEEFSLIASVGIKSHENCIRWNSKNVSKLAFKITARSSSEKRCYVKVKVINSGFEMFEFKQVIASGPFELTIASVCAWGMGKIESAIINMV